jgi:dTDP-glucose pyrophosphorylase
MKKSLLKFIVNETATISEAYKKMLKNKMGIIFMCNKEYKLIGLISDGDFKRAFWSNIDLENLISSIGKKKNFFSIKSKKDLKKINFFPSNINHVPIIRNDKLIDVVFNIKKKKKIKTKTTRFSLVILAGGYGKRLKPITNLIPKALVKVNKKVILDLILNKFSKYSIDKIYLALFHKKELIKSHINKKGLKKINFIEENKRTGTAGPLSKIDLNKKYPIIVTNCDTIINYNYNEIIKFHLKNLNSITIVGFLFEQNINYGVCSVTSKGELVSLIEKPKIKLLANCGFYIFSPDVIKFINKDQFLDMDTFIKKISKKGFKIGVYPIREESWIDIGTLDKYKKANKKFKL